MLFLDNFWLLKPPKTRGGCPPTPFHILNFITLFLLSQKTWQFRPQDVSGASFFDGVYDVFCTRLNFYTKQCNIKNYQKITKKNNFLLVFSFFGLPPLAPNGPFPRAIFDGICDVLCTSSTRSAADARPHIAKAKATPHAMRSNMPGIRCLVHRRI